MVYGKYKIIANEKKDRHATSDHENGINNQ